MIRSRSALSRTLTALLLGALVLNLAPLAVPPGRVAAAAGAPLLVLVDSATDPLSTYVQEILNAEGVKDYEVRPLGDLTSGALLSGRRAVLLGEATPTGAQISALDTFVSGGGGLVAMRPAAGLNAILGVTRQGATTAEGYLQITDPTYGAGLSGDTLQFHGTASQYTLAGAAQVAALYSSRTAPTGLPAVTLATHGAGQAALFSFDLGRSVALTRQGNPASANVDVDGDGIVRTIDLYKNWADLERTSVPQADLQQRLLVRLLQTVMAQPLPRLWYFPNAAPTVLVATGDAHANPDAYYQAEIDALRQIGATATFYLSPAGNPAAATLAGWQALGFDFAPHPYVDCSGGCSGGCSGAFDCGYDDAFAWFAGTYGFAPRTVRTHQVRAAGWTDAAAVQAQHGVGMSFDTYQWGQWLTTASGAPALGYLDGSGQPMRYIDAGGTLLPLYQQHTVLVDEELAPQAGLRGLGLADAVAAARQVIDASVDGYYTPITTQFHVDYFYPDNSTWALQTAQYALQRGAPSLTAAAWLSFVQQRAATTVTTSAWAANTLSFTVGSGGAGQTLLVPLQYGTTALATLKVNGAAASYAPMVVNGTAFAAVSVQSGAYVATYAPDTTAPTVYGMTPPGGATNVSSSTPIGATFSEVMNRTSAQAAFALAPSVPGAFSWDATGTTMTFTPSAPLAANTPYTATISTGATDLAGNPLASPTSWSFTTATVTPPPSVSGVSPISGPITGGTSVTISGNSLAGTTAVAFGGTLASGFTVTSDAALTATAPAHAAGVVNITVTTPIGTSAVSPTDRYTYVDQTTALTVTAVDPATGTGAGGAVVTIAGANFAPGASVTIGGSVAMNVGVASTTSITATTPTHAAGVVDVTVTNPGAQSVTLTGGYTYVACPTGCVTQTTAADFAAGTSDAGVYPGETADGELTLTPKTGTEFGGAALPAGWTAAPWGGGGGATVGAGRLTVDGALVATDTYYTPGRSLEFVATFDATAPAQHVGLGLDLNGSPWAIFSTGSSGGTLYARSNAAAPFDTPIPGNWLGAPHRFRIDWTTSGITYSIDGSPVASHPIGNTGDLRPVISDGPVGGGSLALDWLRLSPYAAAGTFTSGVLDAGDTVTWNTLAWAADVPTGATLALSVHTSADGANWTAFAPVTSGGTVGSTARYVQYRAEFTTADDTVTPTLRDVTIAYTAAAAPVVTAQPAVQAVLSGATVTFTAAASGAPTPTVQWQVSTDSGAHWAALGGATGTTLTFIASAAQDSTQYRAVFTNAAGTAATAAATLTVTPLPPPNQAPVVTAQPSSQTVLAGQPAAFTAAAGNPAPTVQWQVSTNGGQTWADLGGATGTTLTFTASAAQNGNRYRAVFTNAAGTATTAAATLTVTLPNQAPSFTAGPNQAVATNAGPQTVPSWATHIAAGPANESGQSLTFLVTSNTNAALFSAGPAIDPVGTLTFTPAHDAGGTATLTVALGDDGGTANGGQDTSAPQTFTITVTPGAPTVTAQPSSQTVLAGQPATFTAATGNPAPTVQWQVSTNGGQTWADLGGATGTTLTFTASAAQDNNQYRAVFTNAAGTVATAAATLIVTPTTPIFTLAVTSSAGGQASPAGTTPAPAGAAVQLTATPAAGYLFTGWTIDGQFAGFRTPLTLSMTRDRTARAAFAPRPALPDVPATAPAAAAIARLNALGVLRGYGDGRIGPNDVSLRAQMAALIARAMGWDQVNCGNPFPDRGQVDNDLWRNVGALNCKHVAQGFPDGTFRPTGPVLQVQVLSFITRAMVAQGYWRQAATDDPRIYPNVPVASGHRLDLVTFVHYAGAMPDQPANQGWAGWDAPASRGWFAQLLDNALSSQFEGINP